jgi:hypothetical protein
MGAFPEAERRIQDGKNNAQAEGRRTNFKSLRNLALPELVSVLQTSLPAATYALYRN